MVPTARKHVVKCFKSLFYSIHGKVPELTKLFICDLIHKLFKENGYEHKD